MIDDLRALAVFAKTAETGSFRAAAALLQLSPSVVSHHVSQLEARLGVALLYRSTRRLSLTQEGRALLDHARVMLEAAERGLGAVAQRASAPVGTLSIALPAFLTRGPLVNGIAAFAIAHPKVSLQLEFSDIKQDLVRDGFDIAFRIGPLEDSSLKSRKLIDLQRRLVAAPGSMSDRPRPRSPEDLRDWNWIGLRMRPHERTLVAADGRRRTVKFTPRVVVNSVEALQTFAVAGVGLATPPAILVEDDIAAGRLVELLPGWHVPSLGIHAVWPPNAPRQSLTYRLMTFLGEQLSADDGGR